MPTLKKSNYPLDPLGKSLPEAGRKASPQAVYAAAGVRHQAVSRPQVCWWLPGPSQDARPTPLRARLPPLPRKRRLWFGVFRLIPSITSARCCLWFSFPCPHVTHSRFHLRFLPRSRFTNVTGAFSGTTPSFTSGVTGQLGLCLPSAFSFLYIAKIATVGYFIHAKESWSDLHSPALRWASSPAAGPALPSGKAVSSEDCPGMGNLIGLGAGAKKIWKKLLHFFKAVSGGSPTACIYLMQKCFALDAEADKPNHSFLKVQIRHLEDRK